MKILAIDSTAVVASAAICDIENGIINKYSLLSLKNGLTHSVNLLPLIDSAIKYYGTDISEIELISVTAGPGSFTGVRIGVATVKGLAFSDNIPVCGISTLDALAKNCENFSQIICP
ncbi:MAG: tRNA (adenosine(37)-N6)-threonylcarbamoyltransferase complex dimerization subunit type 1 TsaB, partial [Clostridia bacterium]